MVSTSNQISCFNSDLLKRCQSSLRHCDAGNPLAGTERPGYSNVVPTGGADQLSDVIMEFLGYIDVLAPQQWY